MTSRRRLWRKPWFWVLIVLFLLLFLATFLLVTPKASAPKGPTKKAPKPAAITTIPQQPTTAIAQTEPQSSASLTLVVNKKHPLSPLDYAPADLVQPSVSGLLLRSEAASALTDLFGAASQAGLQLSVISAYRSYGRQVTVYNGYVAQNGVAVTDTFSARPGYSEHQTGLAADIGAASGACKLSACFGTTAEGKWLAEHAWEYGFLLRYPSDKVEITGYTYEPWHFRYIGKPTAQALKTVGVTTLEEYFHVDGGTSY